MLGCHSGRQPPWLTTSTLSSAPPAGLASSRELGTWKVSLMLLRRVEVSLPLPRRVCLTDGHRQVREEGRGLATALLGGLTSPKESGWKKSIKATQKRQLQARRPRGRCAARGSQQAEIRKRLVLRQHRPRVWREKAANPWWEKQGSLLTQAALYRLLLDLCSPHPSSTRVSWVWRNDDVSNEQTPARGCGWSSKDCHGDSVCRGRHMQTRWGLK